MGTLRTLAAHREIMDRLITEHRGRIANTAGDSVLAEFPSVVDAVKCAVEVQRALAEPNEGVPEDRRMSFRIGIYVGDVMVRGADLIGDAINIASRLQALAAPDAPFFRASLLPSDARACDASKQTVARVRCQHVVRRKTRSCPAAWLLPPAGPSRQPTIGGGAAQR